MPGWQLPCAAQLVRLLPGLGTLLLPYSGHPLVMNFLETFSDLFLLAFIIRYFDSQFCLGGKQSVCVHIGHTQKKVVFYANVAS